ncbi:hypothetical protein QN277_012160 [Acacia crassicarpa]|uniref:TIR domain-containing protein n=1 Tax=Acacia crassicarpa TaxID=499986 RepID=A0AAE1TCK8_9FABA|nr:hypothetical protein QN277_012160 [Acacia crassicarpa]
MISNEVSARIEEFPFHVEYFSVGLESQVQKVISLVDVGSNEEIKVIGICGIRKSAITRVVCNVIAHHFEDLWYFDGVREAARGYDSTWDDFHKWITQPSFPERKILLILEIPDGAEELDQLGLVRECDQFGEGSRIIVVTRDKQLLVSHGVEIIYDDEWNSPLDEKGKNPKEKYDLKAKQAVLPSGWTYDVFMSYKGGDKCSSFVYHLYDFLCQRRVRAIVNDELVKTSEENLKAMRESRTAIIVISKNYASSPSCLDSLAIIHEYFRLECRFIYPIFYDVEPLELQYQTGSYGDIFARLGKMVKQNVQKWRLTLYEAANSRGIFEFSPRFVTNETQDKNHVEMISNEVSARIEEFPFHVEYFSVGLESQVQKVISLVDVGSNEEIKVIGICGIRKSAITRVVCNVIAHHFEDLWYFDGVREAARGYDSTWDDFHKWITQPSFPERKILLILEIPDGAEELDQLGLVRECDQFGEGSRIIVVTRDKQLLVSHGVEIIYDDEWNSPLDEKGKNPKEKDDLKAKQAVLPSGWTYDVFMSYKGGDKCSSFVYHLYDFLCQRRVRAIVNDELVKTSEENSKAMRESRTAIIVISKNYASSPSCLDSLAIIHECFRMKCRFIYPIFYDVEPFELRYQTGSYGDIFARLGKMVKQNVQKWRLALYEAANSRGIFDFSPKYLLSLLLSYSSF